jgi:hypothetical protein
MRFCTSCGTPVSGLLRFCTRCGAPLTRPAADLPDEQPRAEVAPVAPAEPAMEQATMQQATMEQASPVPAGDRAGMAAGAGSPAGPGASRPYPGSPTPSGAGPVALPGSAEPGAAAPVPAQGGPPAGEQELAAVPEGGPLDPPGPETDGPRPQDLTTGPETSQPQPQDLTSGPETDVPQPQDLTSGPETDGPQPQDLTAEPAAAGPDLTAVTEAEGELPPGAEGDLPALLTIPAAASWLPGFGTAEPAAPPAEDRADPWPPSPPPAWSGNRLRAAAMLLVAASVAAVLAVWLSGPGQRAAVTGQPRAGSQPGSVTGPAPQPAGTGTAGTGTGTGTSTGAAGTGAGATGGAVPRPSHRGSATPGRGTTGRPSPGGTAGHRTASPPPGWPGQVTPERRRGAASAGQGTTGATGTQGGAGSPGPSGSQGGAGQLGSSGAQGGAGNPGSSGAQGGAGNPGSSGAQGGAGQPGPTGPQGGTAHSGTGHPSTSHPGTSHPGSSHPGTSHPGTGPHPAPHAARPAGIVTVTPRLAHSPLAQPVAALLDRYFAAINHRDYRQYLRLFGRWHQVAPRRFRLGYRSTRDSHAVLLGVAGAQRGLVATVTFQSRQGPAASPDHARCDEWTIKLYLRRAGHNYLIVPPPAGYQARYHACQAAR